MWLVKNQYLKIEDAFFEAYNFVNSQIDTYVLFQSEHNSDTSRDHNFQPNGNKADWENFRDLFEALIMHNESLSSIARFQYSKTWQTGEAENLIEYVKGPRLILFPNKLEK